MTWYTRTIAVKNGRKFQIQYPVTAANEDDAYHSLSATLQVKGFSGLEFQAVVPTKKHVEVSVVLLPEVS